MRAIPWDRRSKVDRFFSTVAAVGIQETMKRGTRLLFRLQASGINLTGATLLQIDLSESVLDGALCERTDFRKANLQSTSMRGAWLWKANLSWVQAGRVDLRLGTLDKADFTEADLTDAVMMSASLRDAIMVRAEFDRANLDGADLSGVLAESCTFDGGSLRRADLSHAALPATGFRDADLTDANLTAADLRGADLVGAKLEGCVLEGARFGAEENDEHGRPLRSRLSQRDIAPVLPAADLLRATWDRIEISGREVTRADLSRTP